MLDAGRRQSGHHLVVVDQQGRALVAQAGTRGGGHADTAIRTHDAGLQLEPRAQCLQQGLAAQHAVSDVVAEQHAVLAYRLRVQETVKTGHALHMGQWQMQRFGDLAQGRARDPVLLCLHFAQHLHQAVWRLLMAREKRIKPGMGVTHKGGFLQEFSGLRPLLYHGLGLLF